VSAVRVSKDRYTVCGGVPIETLTRYAPPLTRFVRLFFIAGNKASSKGVNSHLRRT